MNAVRFIDIFPYFCCIWAVLHQTFHKKADSMTLRRNSLFGVFKFNLELSNTRCVAKQRSDICSTDRTRDDVVGGN